MNERGFTLLELLVALAIVSIAALTLLRLDAFAIRSAGDLNERTVAQIVVHNHAIMLLTDLHSPVVGQKILTRSNAGMTWQVEQTVATTADPSLLRIDLVARRETSRAQAALTIIRPIQRPIQ